VGVFNRGKGPGASQVRRWPKLKSTPKWVKKTQAGWKPLSGKDLGTGFGFAGAGPSVAQRVGSPLVPSSSPAVCVEVNRKGRERVMGGCFHREFSRWRFPVLGFVAKQPIETISLIFILRFR
jgi:hypothetical protein